VISGSVSGVADCSILVGCDAVPDVSKGRVVSICRVKQTCCSALNVCVTRCVLAGDVALILCESKCLTGC
jgi:hypothetical protein